MPTNPDNSQETQETLWVERTYLTAGKPTWSSQEDPKKLEVRRFLVPPAYVNVRQTATINLGNYESVKVECGVSLPCYSEEVEVAYQRAWGLVENEMGKQIEDVRTGREEAGRAPKTRGGR